MNLACSLPGLVTAFAALATCFPSARAVADMPVILIQAPFGPDFGLLPRLAGTDSASERINADLARIDRDRRLDWQDAQGGENGFWERDTEVTFPGPLFVGFADYNGYYFDRAAHPDSFAAFLTYDLATGARVDWARLLPQRLIGALNSDSDRLASPELTALYTASLLPREGSDCADWPGPHDLSFTFSLDARSASVVMHPQGFSYAEKACADDALISLDNLRAAGAATSLTDALQAASP